MEKTLQMVTKVSSTDTPGMAVYAMVKGVGWVLASNVSDLSTITRYAAAPPQFSKAE